MFIENQRGAVLVVVIVAMAALLTLGVTLSTVALSDQRQAIRQEKNNEAFYLARSGAETVAEFLLENQSKIDSYIGQTTESELGNGRFEVLVEKDEEEGTILIHSTGYVGDYSERVTLTLIPGDESSEGSTNYFPEFDLAVFSNTTIELTGSSMVDGNIGTNSTAPNTVNLAWSSSVNYLYVCEGGDVDKIVKAANPPGNYLKIGWMKQRPPYEMPEFPNFPELQWKGDLSTVSMPLEISEDGYYGIVDVKQPLIVNVGNGVRKIRMKELRLHGSGHIPPDFESSTITVVGTGVLDLYIEEKIHEINGCSSINFGGDVCQVMIYYKGDSDVNVTGDAIINGCMFSESKKAGFKLWGSAGINGVIFFGGENAKILGGSTAVVTIFYAPFTHVEVSGGGKFTGAIIGNSVSILGNGRVAHDPDVYGIWTEIPNLDFEVGPLEGSGNSAVPVYIMGEWSE